MTLDQAIERLRELNEPVPIPVRLPSDEEIDAAEKELKARFHSDFRRYLKEASDVVYGAMEPATITVDGAHNNLATIAAGAWEEMELPRKFLPFCEDNGDYYCMTKSGKVVFWSHDDQDLNGDEWPDLATWIGEVWLEGEMEEESE